MNAWTMRMSMDQPLHLSVLHVARNGLLIDIHDVTHGLLRVLLATATDAIGNAFASRYWQAAEQALYQRVTHNTPQALVRDIIGTQQVAMTQ